MKPKVWTTPAGRLFDLKYAATLLGLKPAKLRAMIYAGELSDPADKREAVFEADVIRLRAERGRVRVEVTRRAVGDLSATKLGESGRPITRLRERPTDQAVLDWSPNVTGKPR